MAENNDKSSTQSRYTTRDAERDRDEFMSRLREELPEAMRPHVGVRKRCSICRRYVEEHPTGSEKYCKRDRLEGQEWITSICGERDTYRDLIELVTSSKKNLANASLMDDKLAWYQDQLRTIVEQRKEEWEEMKAKNSTMLASLKDLIEGVQRFAHEPYSDTSVRRLMDVGNEAVRKMREMKKDKGGESGSSDKDTDDDDGDDDDDNYDDYDDYESENDYIDEVGSGKKGWGRTIRHSEGADRQNDGPNDDENVNDGHHECEGPKNGKGTDDGGKNVASGSNSGKKDGFPPLPPSPTKRGDGKAVAGTKNGKGSPKVSFGSTTIFDPDERPRGELTMVKGDASVTAPVIRMTEDNVPYLVLPPSAWSGTTASDTNSNPNPNPTPLAMAQGSGVPQANTVLFPSTVRQTPASTTSYTSVGSLPPPPDGSMYPGLFDPPPGVSLHFCTTGHLCGGRPEMGALKYLTKMVTTTIHKNDSVEVFIDKYQSLKLNVTIHGGSETMYTLLALFVKLTPSLHSHYADMLDKKSYYRSFVHFMEEFIEQNFPDLQAVSYCRLQRCVQKQDQSVRDYRIEYLELLKLAQKDGSQYVYEFLRGIRSDRHKKAVETKEWQKGAMTIDAITEYLSRMDDLTRVNNSMARITANVAVTNQGRSSRSFSAPATSRGAMMNRGAIRGRPRMRGVGGGRNVRGRGLINRGSFRRAVGPGRAASVATATNVAAFTPVRYDSRSGSRGRSAARGRGFSRGRGPMRNGSRGGSRNLGNRLGDRIAMIKRKRKQLNLEGGAVDTCYACFNRGHQMDMSFSKCTGYCIFCNSPMTRVRHGHMECRKMPWDFNDARKMVLAKRPYMDSAGL